MAPGVEPGSSSLGWIAFSTSNGSERSGADFFVLSLFASLSFSFFSGFPPLNSWEDARKQIANKAYLIHQQHGRGHVVAFAEDPNYRAFMDGLNLLFMNAIFFGPAH